MGTTPGSERGSGCGCGEQRPLTRVHVLVPVKRPEFCKTRLAAVLPTPERLALVRALARRVAGAVEGSGVSTCSVIVSSGCPDAVEAMGLARGAWQTLDVGDLALNEGLDAAVDWCASRGADRVLILPVDLPFADALSVRAVVAEALRTGRHVIVPDLRGTGTNALCMNLAQRFGLRFGTGSLQRHLEAARRAGDRCIVIRGSPLCQDLDTAEDLALVRPVQSGLMPKGDAQERADARAGGHDASACPKARGHGGVM